MNAQEIINTSNFKDNLSLFYPDMAKQKQADLNLTKLLKEVKNNGRTKN